MTQHETILQLLNKSEWVCGTEFQQNYIPEYRTRINEIRKDGFIVEARRCAQHTHKGIMQEWGLRLAETLKNASGTTRRPVRAVSPEEWGNRPTVKPSERTSHGNYSYYPPEPPKVCCPIAKASNNRMHAAGCETQKKAA